MVMIMTRYNRIKKHRITNQKVVFVSFLVMAFCYLLGCFFGCRFGYHSDVVHAFVSALTENSFTSESRFLSVFGSFGFYGALFLLLSTSYMGFVIIPVVFFAKGFVTGSLFLSDLQGEMQNALLLAGIQICLPELFVLSGLLLLGYLCMHLSFRLLCRFRGAPAAEDDHFERLLLYVFLLFSAAALLQTYVVPALTKAAAA